MKKWFIIVFFLINCFSLLAQKNYVQHIGHSTVLIHLNGLNVLTDPNWNDMNLLVRRSNPPAIPINKLPEIDVVLISHGHFDHLDLNTIETLHKFNKKIRYYIPKNLGCLLEELSITNFMEVDADKTYKYKSLEFHTYRARHDGSRYWFSNLDTSLALCYLIKGTKTVFFSGDTGYTNLFQKIGNNNRVDMALLEMQGWAVYKLNGKKLKRKKNGYSKWDIDKENGYLYINRHLHPRNTIRALIDLKAKQMIPIHYDAFFVEFRKGREDPVTTLTNFAHKKNVHDKVLINKIGKKISIP